MDVFEAIALRRSIRRYTGAPVPRADLEKIVNAGRLAASGSNLQPWDFVVVTDCEKIDQLKLTHAWIHDAGAIIAVVMDPSSRWWIEDGAAAVQNMLLAITALGYGACWVEGFTLRNEDRLRELLGIPANRRLMTLLPVGVPAEQPEKEKRSLEDVLHWDTF
jgi:nitroreductase